jgi:hypothetical protein
MQDDSVWLSDGWSLSFMVPVWGVIVNDEHNIPPVAERMSFLTWVRFFLRYQDRGPAD